MADETVGAVQTYFQRLLATSTPQQQLQYAANQKREPLLSRPNIAAGPAPCGYPTR
jgi:hypothetical protein